MKLKLPRQLGLAAGKRGILGTADLSPLPRSKIRHGKRMLRATAPSGAGALALSAGSGALDGLGTVGKRLSFRVTLIDVNGKKTSLKLKVRAR